MTKKKRKKNSRGYPIKSDDLVVERASRRKIARSHLYYIMHACIHYAPSGEGEMGRDDRIARIAKLLETVTVDRIAIADSEFRDAARPLFFRLLSLISSKVFNRDCRPQPSPNIARGSPVIFAIYIIFVGINLW